MAISKSTCLLPPFRMGLNSRLAWPWPAWAEECAAHPSVRVASAALLGDGLAVTWELSHAGAAMVQRWAGFLTDADVSWGGAAPPARRGETPDWSWGGAAPARRGETPDWSTRVVAHAGAARVLRSPALGRGVRGISKRQGCKHLIACRASGLQAPHCLAMGWL